MAHPHRDLARVFPTLGAAAIDDDARIDVPSLPSGPAPSAPFAGWPAAGPHSSDHWDHSAAPAEYMIRSGDTISGLAARYLGAGHRWREIWELQVGSGSRPARRYVNRYVNKIDPSSSNPGPLPAPGDYLLMPAEAAARAKQLDAAGQSVPGAGGSPGTIPGGQGPMIEPPAAKKGFPVGLALAGGAALVGLGFFVFGDS